MRLRGLMIASSTPEMYLAMFLWHLPGPRLSAFDAGGLRRCLGAPLTNKKAPARVFSGGSLCFLVGRVGLEPTTLGLKSPALPTELTTRHGRARSRASAESYHGRPLLVLPGPLALREHGDLLAGRGDAPDVQVVGADHEVDVRAGLVHTRSQQLSPVHVKAAGQALREPCPQGQMTACVFVVQRVIEEDARLAYGSVLRDERALTQAAAVLVRFDDVPEDVLAAFGPEVDDPARLEPKPEVAHHTARMHEGHGRVDDAVGTKAVRRGKDLLGGNVGKERGAIRQVACTALQTCPGFMPIVRSVPFLER